MSQEQIDAILTRLRASDKAALQELFHTYYPNVCASIHRIIKDRDTVEDLAQEVFIRFWEKRTQLEIKTSIKAYLHRMGINEALGYLRKQKRYQIEEYDVNTSTELDRSSEEQFLHSELKDQVSAVVDTLPPKCKLVFQLSRYEELSYKEIAEKLDISVKTVENQMSKALKVLRKGLASYLHVLFILLLKLF